MKTFAYTLELKNDPEIIQKYKAYHKKVWPDVLRGVRENGVHKSMIFLLGTRLFLIIEADDHYDLLVSQNRFSSESERNWDKMMRTFQLPVSEASPDEWWAEMELVYDFEEQYHRAFADGCE